MMFQHVLPNSCLFLMPTSLVDVAILLWRRFTYHFQLLAGGAVFAGTFRRLMK